MGAFTLSAIQSSTPTIMHNISQPFSKTWTVGKRAVGIRLKCRLIACPFVCPNTTRGAPVHMPYQPSATYLLLLIDKDLLTANVQSGAPLLAYWHRLLPLSMTEHRSWRPCTLTSPPSAGYQCWRQIHRRSDPVDDILTPSIASSAGRVTVHQTRPTLTTRRQWTHHQIIKSPLLTSTRPTLV